MENVTLTGSGAILFRRRIEAKDAWKFYNQPAHYSARVYHDHGANVDFIITVRKADTADDFASTTDIATDTISIANDANADIDLAIADMGIATTVLRLKSKWIAARSPQRIRPWAERQFSIGTAKRPFRPATSIEEALVHRYLRPLAAFWDVANSGSNMQEGLFSIPACARRLIEVNAPIAATDGWHSGFCQSTPASPIHENTPHHGRVDIAYFSGLTSGRFHIQRGAGGFILASAEL